MKYLPSLGLSLCCLFLFSQMLAQQTPTIIHLMEESTTGKYHDTIRSGGIVDINSIIRIQVNRAEVEQQLFEMAGIPDSSGRLQQLQTLNRLLSYEARVVGMLKDIRSGPNAPLQAYVNWAKLEEEFMAMLAKDALELHDAIYERLDNEEFGDFDATKVYTDTEFAIYVIQNQAKVLRAELTEAFGFSEGNQDSSLLVYFRLGAFLKNREGGRPIHVENFDTYEPEKFNEIQRFSSPSPASASEEEKQEIKKNARLANQMIADNEDMLGAFSNQMKQKSEELFSSKVAFQELLSTAKSVRDSMKGKKIKAEFSLGLDENVDKLDLVRQAYDIVATTLSQPLSPGLLEEIPLTLATKLETPILKAQTQLQTLTTKAKTEGSDPVIAQQFAQLSGQYEALRLSVEQDISKLQALFQDASGLFSLFKKSSLDNEEFSDKVKRLRPGNIPAEGFIELKYIGERRPGDEILIKATLEKGDNPRDANYEQREVFRQYLSLMRVSAHIKMSGSLILANPYTKATNANVTLKNSFQFAPSYGIFIKWGSRRSRFFNDFVNLGIGMSFTSPDFNLDGTPEFGAGAVLTGFRDWVSAGWGWNFGVDAPYTFVGFNIPFTVAGFSSPSGVNDAY